MEKITCESTSNTSVRLVKNQGCAVAGVTNSKSNFGVHFSSLAVCAFFNIVRDKSIPAMQYPINLQCNIQSTLPIDDHQSTIVYIRASA